MNDIEAVETLTTDTDPDTSTNESDARVEQLTSDINDTRGDLTSTIEEIGQKLDPSNIAHEATETVRAATLGKVEQMTYGAQETWRDVRTINAGSIVDTIKSNPIPAALVAVGVGMLFMNRGQQPSQAASYRPERGAAWDSQAPDRRNGGSSPIDKLGSTVSDAGDRVGEVADQAGRKVSDAFGSVGETAGQLPEQAGHAIERGSTQVRRFLDANPLAAAAIALAAGAAIGMVLPTTPLERDAIGPVRDQVVTKVEGTVNEAMDKVDAESVQATAA